MSSVVPKVKWIEYDVLETRPPAYLSQCIYLNMILMEWHVLIVQLLVHLRKMHFAIVYINSVLGTTISRCAYICIYNHRSAHGNQVPSFLVSGSYSGGCWRISVCWRALFLRQTAVAYSGWTCGDTRQLTNYHGVFQQAIMKASAYYPLVILYCMINRPGWWTVWLSRSVTCRIADGCITHFTVRLLYALIQQQISLHQTITTTQRM